MRFGAVFLTLSLTLAMLAACSDDESFAQRAGADEGSELNYSSSETDASSSSDNGGPSSLPEMSSSSKRREFFNVDIDFGEFTDERDGHVYKTVVIGNQKWMAQNLNFEYRVNDSIYQNECNATDGNCDLIGRDYTWAAVMDSAGVFSQNGANCGGPTVCTPIYPVRGVCPEGWHVPDITEYHTMMLYAATANLDAKKLLSEKGWHEPGTNDYGFSMLPDSLYARSGLFDAVFIWTSTEQDDYDVYTFYASPDGVSLFNRSNKTVPKQLRCVNDTLFGNVAPMVPYAEPCKTEVEDGCEYGTLTDTRDNQIYKTVKIGSQVWMAENLNFNAESSLVYIDSLTGEELYGRHYTRPSIKAYDNICPEGWHLPSREEWGTLIWATSRDLPAGKALKDAYGWAGDEADSFGFSVLPGGQSIRDKFSGYGKDEFFLSFAYFWMVQENEIELSYLYLAANDACVIFRRTDFGILVNSDIYGYSIRCIKD